MSIDIHTLSLALSITNLLQAFALLTQFRLEKNSRGLGWWAAGSAAMMLGFGINHLQDHPDFGQSSIIANNLLFVIAMAFFYTGTLRFFHQREQRVLLISLCTATTLAAIYFTYILDNLLARRVNISLALAIMSFLNARAFLVFKIRSVTLLAHFLTIVFLSYGIFFILRTFSPETGGQVGGLFTASLTQAASYLVTLIASSLWTFGMIMLVNQRSHSENLESKENLELIFNTSPDAVLITRVNDGYCVDVNDGFTAMTGYSRADVMGKSVLEINLWKNAADRKFLVKTLAELGVCHNLEAEFQRKDGESFYGTVSAKVVTLQGVPQIISVVRDISEQKRVRELERESEEKHRILFTDSPDAYLITMDGKFADCNRATEAMLRGDRSKIIGQPPEILSPEFQPDGRKSALAAQEKIDEALLNGNISFQWVHRRLDGSEFLVDVSLTPMELDGKTALFTIWRDITERKQAEEALRESEQNYRTLADSGQALVWLAGEDKLCYYFNSVWLKFTGRTLEQESGNGWAEGVHPEDFQRCLDTYVSAFDRREDFSMEYRLRRHDGKYRWLLDEGSPRYDSKGIFIGYIGHCLDITERKLVEDALLESKNQINLLLQSTNQGIYGIDLNGGCTFINQSGLNMIGYTLDECSGQNMHALIHHSYADGTPFSVEDCPIFNCKLTGEEVSLDDEVLWRKDGSCFPAEYSAHLTFEDGKITGTVISFTDITQRKKAELALQTTTEELKLFNSQLEDSIANANEMAAQSLQAETMIREREANLNEAQHLAHVGSWKYIVATGETSWSNEMFHIFGLTPASEAPDWSALRKIIHPDDKSSFDKTFRRAIIKNEPYSLEIRAIHSNGSLIWLLLSGGKDTTKSTRNAEWVAGTIQDITERKLLEEKLHQQATTDVLTGVINRRRLLEMAHIEIKRSTRVHRPLAIALIDIDHFKFINDTYGHAAGDQVLITFTKICMKSIREFDVFARFGGDEFALLLPETDIEQANAVVERIRGTIADLPLELEGKPAHITISSGIADLANDQETFDTVLSRADQALYNAKEAGRNKVMVFKV